MRKGGRSEFKSKDGRKIVIRPLRRGELRAVLKYANTLSRERRTNPDLGIVSLDRRMTMEDERRFLNRIISGRRTKDEVSLAAFAGDRMVGHCHVSRR